MYALLGWINVFVEKTTGKDLLGAALPIVLGEWGDLRRIADAHDEMERGFDLIAQDLTDGMDALSTHWTSDSAGASTSFDYHMRQRWIKGFPALANFSNSAQQTYEWIANAYEYIVSSFLLALNFYAGRITGALKALGSATEVTTKALWNPWQLVTATFQLIVDTIRMIYLQIKMFVSGIEMMVANLHFFLNYFRGDFDVFTEA